MRSFLALGTISLSIAIVNLVAPTQVQAQTPLPDRNQRPLNIPNNRHQTCAPPNLRPQNQNRQPVVPPASDRPLPRPQSDRQIPTVNS